MIYACRVLMNCVYSGHYNEEHRMVRKRRMIGPTINMYTSAIFNEGVSCETTREREVNRLMTMGE